MKNRTIKNEWWLTLPSFTWLSIFFLIPTCIIFVYAFKPPGLYGGIEPGWSLEAIESLWNSYYATLIVRTLFLGLTTAAICLLLALPVGYQMATISKKARSLLVLLIILPFWSSFLIRIFAWKILLHPEGFIKKALVFLHLVDPGTTLLYNLGAVLLVMVYTYLPFAVFPIYAAASKFNFQLMEAAMDLGATRSQAFFKVFVPGIAKGIYTGAVMVFISAVGAYVIPDLIGGVNSDMLGNKIALKVFVDRNLPQASALSVLLALVVLLPLLIGTTIFNRSKQKFEPEELRSKE
jgi:spermidine/putrescine transport system permease protein